MRKICPILFLLLSLAAQGQLAIGEWRDHSSFVAAHHLCVGEEQVYAATRMAMFYYDKEANSTRAMTKQTGLTDVGISTIAYNEAENCLVVAYDNSALDIRQDGTVSHIADIRHSGISGDKKIYHVRFHDKKIYLATGFGIVVVDMARKEIEETYYLGENGTRMTIYDIAFTDSLIVAAIDGGILYAPKESGSLRIADIWQRDTLAPLHGMSVRMLEVNGGRLVAAACTDNPDSMTVFYQQDHDDWGSWGKSHIESLRCHNGYILLNHFNNIEIFDDNYQPLSNLTTLSTYGVSVWDADIEADGTLWLGHTWGGLLRVPKGYSDCSSYHPAGPSTDDNVYSLTTTADKLYVCPGGKKPTYESSYINGGMAVYDNADKAWLSMQHDNIGTPFMDVLNVVVDPRDKNHVSATAWGFGVLDIQNNEAQGLYNESNTDGALTPYQAGDFKHLRVSGLAYDDAGNLWITNSLVNNGLAVRYRDGSWASFNTVPLFNGLRDEQLEIDKIIWDSINGYKWFAGRANRIYVHDGDGKMAYVNPNHGSKLETHSVNCLVQDRAGDIWFGTDKGIKVIYDGYRAFANGGHGELSPVNCSNILYSEDGIYEYLMAYEGITCMAVDGANRKWVGTSNNGLYLLSANGLEELAHFTTANSPLYSDKIATVAVHPETGVVYIGTAYGLQSYRSTATAAESLPASNIYAFPNPVRPGYDGPIAIKGFTRDALVHVTDGRGHVVYATTAQGGQAIWNGRTSHGDRVASGTYYVFASDKAGKMRSVAKILIIR